MGLREGQEPVVAGLSPGDSLRFGDIFLLVQARCDGREEATGSPCLYGAHRYPHRVGRLAGGQQPAHALVRFRFVPVIGSR